MRQGVPRAVGANATQRPARPRYQTVTTTPLSPCLLPSSPGHSEEPPHHRESAWNDAVSDVILILWRGGSRIPGSGFLNRRSQVRFLPGVPNDSAELALPTALPRPVPETPFPRCCHARCHGAPDPFPNPFPRLFHRPSVNPTSRRAASSRSSFRWCTYRWVVDRFRCPAIRWTTCTGIPARSHAVIA